MTSQVTSSPSISLEIRGTPPQFPLVVNFQLAELIAPDQRGSYAIIEMIELCSFLVLELWHVYKIFGHVNGHFLDMDVMDEFMANVEFA